MTRFAHPYGGTCTVVGTFTRREVERRIGHPIAHGKNEKVYDGGTVEREVLVYATGDDDMLRMEVINRP